MFATNFGKSVAQVLRDAADAIDRGDVAVCGVRIADGHQYVYSRSGSFTTASTGPCDISVKLSGGIYPGGGGDSANEAA